MPVFRVERNKGYTVMSNYHLRDKSLSLKAKGLLSQILSLPEDWDYTLSGLCYINRESKDAIRSAVNELERAGYIERHQTTDESGKFSSNEYIIHEQPVSLPPSLDKPSSENPTTGKPTSENPTQLNKDRVTKDQAITDPSITHSLPSLSPPPLIGTSSASLASPQAAKLTRCAAPALPTANASLVCGGDPRRRRVTLTAPAPRVAAGASDHSGPPARPAGPEPIYPVRLPRSGRNCSPRFPPKCRLDGF